MCPSWFVAIPLHTGTVLFRYKSKYPNKKLANKQIPLKNQYVIRKEFLICVLPFNLYKVYNEPTLAFMHLVVLELSLTCQTYQDKFNIRINYFRLKDHHQD